MGHDVEDNDEFLRSCQKKSELAYIANNRRMVISECSFFLRNFNSSAFVVRQQAPVFRATQS